MFPKTFCLDPLINLRRTQRDQRRCDLAQGQASKLRLQQKRYELSDEMNELRDRIRQHAGPGDVDVESLLAMQRYLVLVESKIVAMDQQLDQLGVEIDSRRAALVEADHKTRIIEKLRERHQTREQQKQIRQESKQLDEIGQWCRDAGIA